MNRLSLFLLFVLIVALPSCDKAKELTGLGDAGLGATAEKSASVGKDERLREAHGRVSRAHREFHKRQDAALAEITGAPAVPGACGTEYRELSELGQRLRASSDDVLKRLRKARLLGATSDELESLKESSGEISNGAKKFLDSERAFAACLKANAPAAS